MNRNENKLFQGKNELKRVVDTWRDMGHMSNLSEFEQKSGKMGMRAKKAHFFLERTLESERGEERVKREALILSTIYGARLFDFRRAKN